MTEDLLAMTRGSTKEKLQKSGLLFLAVVVIVGYFGLTGMLAVYLTGFVGQPWGSLLAIILAVGIPAATVPFLE